MGQGTRFVRPRNLFGRRVRIAAPGQQVLPPDGNLEEASAQGRRAEQGKRDEARPLLKKSTNDGTTRNNTNGTKTRGSSGADGHPPSGIREHPQFGLKTAPEAGRRPIPTGLRRRQAGREIRRQRPRAKRRKSLSGFRARNCQH
jgi:hypothetical protein